jgi:ribosomal protein L37AE/L43A
MIDEFITAHAAKEGKKVDPYDPKQHHLEQIRENKKEDKKDRDGRSQHHVAPYQETGVGALQTRYCPEHVGDMLGRVGDGIWQCPRDGAIFNFETGWTDANGVKHPGGSVANQTSDVSNQPVPHRIFDSKENTLNVIN